MDHQRTNIELKFSETALRLCECLVGLYDEYMKEGYIHADSFHFVKRGFKAVHNIEYGVVHSYAAREGGTNQFRFLTRKPFAKTKGKFVYGSIPLSSDGRFSDAQLTKAAYHTGERDLCMLTEYEYARLRHNSYIVKKALRKLKFLRFQTCAKPEYPIVAMKDVPRASTSNVADIQAVASELEHKAMSYIHMCIEIQAWFADEAAKSHVASLAQVLHGQLKTTGSDDLAFYPGRIHVEVLKRKQNLSCLFYLREPSVKAGQYIRVNLPLSKAGYTDRVFEQSALPPESQLCIETERVFRTVRHNVEIIKSVRSGLSKLITNPNTHDIKEKVGTSG